MKFAILFALLLLIGCQSVPAPLSGERQRLEGYFSFISPADYKTELEEDSVFISDSGEEIFISLAVIGAGENDRTAQSLLDEIFGKFNDYQIKTPTQIVVAGLPGQKSEFSGVINNGVVSGNYVVIELGEGVSFLAFGMGKVTVSNDRWQENGQMDFTQLLATVEILFAPPL